MPILSQVNYQLESRMREIRLSGSEGGGTELNRSSLPLCAPVKVIDQERESRSMGRSDPINGR